MTETAGSTDPRPQLSSALDQTQRQVDALSADDATDRQHAHSHV